MRTELLLKVICLGIILFFTLLSGCTKKKTTAPIEPTIFLMKDYFPLNEGDRWTWEVTGDTISESFIDGDVNMGEPFVDANENGIYDFGEQYTDDNFNGKYDGPNDPWTSGVPYEDRNHNGEYDLPDGVWEKGETFADLDGNGICNKAIDLTLSAEIYFPGNNVTYRTGQYEWTQYGTLPPNVWFLFLAGKDAFSNDSLGLRWHQHFDITDWNDYLKNLKPIIIAKANTRIGDTVRYADTSISNVYTWISILLAIENIAVPAGAFPNCLKFETIATGWIGNMAKYNGTSYQWYAKNVGLVKSEGPGEDRRWFLKSARINSKNYP